MTTADLRPHQVEMLAFLLSSGVLSFGEFTLKSGRRSPYFMNFGKICTGTQIETLGRLYGEQLIESFGDGVSIIFGPAYKGIGMAVATATYLSRRLGRELFFSYNRKEPKTYAEGGMYVGRTPSEGDRVVIVEDVVSAGTTFRQVVPLLREQHGVVIEGSVIAVDRRERGPNGRSAVEEVESEVGIRIAPVLTIHQILAGLESMQTGKALLTPELRERIAAYRAEFGA